MDNDISPPTIATTIAQANTVTAASEQGQIIVPSGQSVAESHQCVEDLSMWLMCCCYIVMCVDIYG